MAEPMSDERLAEIREAFGPASVYLSGVAGDGIITMGNQLLAEVERLRGELAAYVKPEPLTAEQLNALRDAMLRADALEAYWQTWTGGNR